MYSQIKQEFNSFETSCKRVGGLIGGVVKKASFSMLEKGLVKKVSFSSLEMRVVKKCLDWSKKEGEIVKKFKKLSKGCQTFRQTW
jgi:hypothetical protein